MSKRKTIFVTGLSGFVGKNLLNYLRENKKEINLVALIHKTDLPLQPPIIEKIPGDVRDFGGLEKIFKEKKFDGIFHLAAVIKSRNLKDYEEVNVKGTENVVKLAEKYGVKKFIFLSSDFILYEKFAPNPYGISKRKCEEIILASKLDYTIFRPTPIFGPGDTKNFANLVSVIKKYPILPALHCLMEPVFVGDVVKMMVKAFESPISTRKIYFLPGGKYYDFPEILKIIAQNLNLKRIIITLPSNLFLFLLKFYETFFSNPLLESYQVRKWLKTKHLDDSETRKDLNYTPISFEEGVKFIIE